MVMGSDEYAGDAVGKTAKKFETSETEGRIEDRFRGANRTT